MKTRAFKTRNATQLVFSAIGLGTALWEKFRLRSGWNITNSLRRTLIADACRIPEIIPIIVEDDEPTGPYGAKGIAEIAAIPSAAAVVNAIRDATGADFAEIPVTRGAVVKALRLEGLRIGPEIDPGVPWTAALGSEKPLALALKSGNFGTPDFFLKAWEKLT